jgi:DNA replication protein DnaC
MDVPIGNPDFGRMQKCSCRLNEDQAQKLITLQKLSNLDSLQSLTFTNFDPDLDGVSEAFQAAIDYADELDGWIFFHGRCGTGKTHLAVAIAHSAIQHEGKSVYFAPVPDLLDQLRATFDPANGVAYDDRFNQIRGSDLLVLDDLGTENATPWAKEKLFQILNFRYNGRLPTVITSNHDFKNIEERIVSRLSDTRLTKYLWVDAEDFRRRQYPAASGFRARR